MNAANINNINTYSFFIYYYYYCMNAANINNIKKECKAFYSLLLKSNTTRSTDNFFFIFTKTFSPIQA